MTLFYVIAALLALTVVIALVKPLLRPAPATAVSAQASNAAVYREQLAQLERELAEGAIGQSEYQSARDELHLRLLQDEQAAAAAAAPAPRSSAAKRSAGAIAVLLPLAAGATYAWLGAPLAIDAQQAAQAQQHDIVRTVEMLAARLEANPDNPKGWAMLARSYKALERMEEAEQAFARVGPSLEQDPDMLAHYADAIVARTRSFDGKPMELIRKALKLDPKHPMSLMLAGTAAYQGGRFADAASEWEKLLATVEAGSPDADDLRAMIGEARQKAGMQPVAPQQQAAKAPAAAPAAQPPGTPEEMVNRLAARLQANPNDPEGWQRLARSYEVLGKPKEAQEARAQAAKYAAK